MADNRSKNITLQDIADHLGLSAMTVSRALSEKSHLVSPETAKLCREAAAKLGYVPNLIARRRRGDQLNTIVMFAEEISSHQYLAQLVDVVSRSIEKRRYSVISCQSIQSYHQALRNFKLTGAIVIAPPEQFYSDPFGQHTGRPVVRGPTVLLHSAVEQNLFNEVSPNITQFNYNAACHLLELGHRHIAYLGGPRADEEPRWFELRRRGIEKALQECGGETSLRQQGCANAAGAPFAMQQLMTRAPQTTAVMCINDEVALAAVSWANKVELKVPRDLSVVGCNNIDLAQFFEPSLTTLEINIQAMVNTALDLLISEVDSDAETPADKPIKILVPANLIVRGSTGPPLRK